MGGVLLSVLFGGASKSVSRYNHSSPSTKISSKVLFIFVLRLRTTFFLLKEPILHRIKSISLRLDWARRD